MLPDDIPSAAVPRLFSYVQNFSSLLAENEWKTRPIWSYYNSHEIKALYWHLRMSRIDILVEQEVKYKCD